MIEFIFKAKNKFKFNKKTTNSISQKIELIE